MRARRLYGWGLFCVAAFAAIAGSDTSAQRSRRFGHLAVTQASETTPADRFAYSIGVNVHLHYNGTLYREAFDLVRQRLIELGVQHVRDILVDTTWQEYYDRHNALGEAGIKSIFIMQRARMDDSVLREYPSRMWATFEGYEAPNELDRTGGAGWAEALRASLAQLHALKSDPVLGGYPIYGPALAFSYRHAELGDVSEFYDYGNLHNYFGGRHPGTRGFGVTDREYPSYTWHFRFATQFFGGKPIVSTETGYMNEPTAPDSVPEDVAGKYMPRLLLEQYRRGVVRTYIYELADEPARGQLHGIIRADGTPKPAYTAVRNLLTLLADPGPPIEAEPLLYSITEAGPDVHHVSFQKRDGSWWLALWIEASGYDVTSRQYVPVAPQTVRVVFGEPRRLVRMHRWRSDGSVERTPGSGTATTMTSITVTDSLLLLELVR